MAKCYQLTPLPFKGLICITSRHYHCFGIWRNYSASITKCMESTVCSSQYCFYLSLMKWIN